MKIQCDVCSKKEASVFCTADEASLCDVCDQRVHHANKLASKHQRFSLLQPSLSNFPICDICQEKRALLFCQEDRAILCRECDIPLHTANEYTQKHNRFLLTGIKLSTTVCDHTLSKINDVISVNDCCDTTVPDFNNNNNNNNNNSAVKCCSDQFNSGASSSSNISDYLIETLPGWHFDDFIVDPASTTPSTFGFNNYNKSGNNNCFEVDEDLTSFFDVEQYEKNLTTYSTQSQNLWVPQAPPLTATTTSQTSTFASSSVLFHGTKQQETSVNAMIKSKKCRKNDVFTVPQITSSIGKGSYKRSRQLW
ncbi:hypothetical protein KSS87_005525 [Heliosperma pusillum]|nr:hypothetical protein KSS87_005525 [Heliosperma pusillum]